MLPVDTCERARRARDARFDGRFYVGSKTTRIYCRPVCPVPPCKPENAIFFPSAAAASEAGFRPCLRCRPEAAPGSPAWVGTSATVSRALRLLADGALDGGDVEGLAARLGIGPRHLRRLFVKHVGASPLAFAQTRRILFAKKLLNETRLSMTVVADCAGFGSVRRFNEVFRRIYGRTPRELRASDRALARVSGIGLGVQLPFRPPFDWQAAVDFLRLRATPGVEQVDDGVYRRTIRVRRLVGRIEITPDLSGNRLKLEVDFPDWRALSRIVQRARRIFDLDADPMVIASHLATDPLLALRLATRPGLRMVSAWDGFEATVRAILGQQVSVQVATTLAGRLAERFGEPLPQPDGQGPHLVFPTAEAIANAELCGIGLPAKRAHTIADVARAVTRGDLDFDAPLDAGAIVQQLTRIPGVGQWTAQYVALRGLGEPDALPAKDLGLLRAAGNEKGAITPSQLRERAEAWRPWRSYAAMHLWTPTRSSE